jgi:DNA-binding response OmpR family regulator
MVEHSNTKILIVDDDKEFLEEAKEMLTLSGYEVATASDGDSTLEQVLTFKPSIIFLDLKMTPKSGFQIADELINTLGMKDLRIIAMTGFFTAKEHVLFMKMCGVKKCILKPIHPLDLISSIEFGIDKKEKEKEESVRT